MHTPSQILEVQSFDDLLNTAYSGQINTICWKRNLQGDFEEIIKAVGSEEELHVLSEEELLSLSLSRAGEVARQSLLSDLKRLSDYGASPVLNIIKHYTRDQDFPFFPTDVYSFHVDRSPIPTHTFLCTYHGASSEIVPNAQAQQKILIPEIRAQLKKLYHGPEPGFESFLQEHFFDLHYQALPHANIIPLGLGSLWRLAVDHPQSAVPPCIHRAPLEGLDEPRLMLIC